MQNNQLYWPRIYLPKTVSYMYVYRNVPTLGLVILLTNSNIVTLPNSDEFHGAVIDAGGVLPAQKYY